MHNNVDNNRIKIVFIDLDGTLLLGVSTVTPETIKAFQALHERGIQPVVCTGRVGWESENALNAINATKYLVASNGQEVYKDYSRMEMLYEGFFETDAYTTIYNTLHDADIYYQAYAHNKAYVPRDRAHHIDNCGWDREHIEYFEKLHVLKDNPIEYFKEAELTPCKFIAVMSDKDEMQKLREEFESLPDVVVYMSGGPVLEILPKHADKRHGVRTVIEDAGLTKDQVMVIGDSENDMGMFDEAGICVAMGNACDMLKEKADIIAPSNAEEGVAWVINKLLAGEL